MKIIIGVLLASVVVVAELPPPISSRGFRPSPRLYPASGAEFQQLTSSLAVDIPPRVTIEQLIRLTEQLQSSRVSNLPVKTYEPPSTSYGVPSKQIAPQYGPPVSHYGPPNEAPNTKNQETFDKVRQNKVPDGFDTQHLPIRGAANFNSGYVPPPTTTVRNYITTPVSSSTEDVDSRAPSSETPDVGDGDDPNVSVATAVAGGGLFYVQQPDGRLQKVVFQKTRDANAKPEEYTANYYFQNIHALPNAVYSPLITLGRK